MVKVLILGYGIRGRAYAQYAVDHPDELQIVGAADPLAEPPPGATYPMWKNWEDALANTGKVDAVVIALPDRLHKPAALAALGKGCHVLLEKPIGCTWEECLEIKSARLAAKKLVLTGFVLRHAAYYRELRRVLDSDAIGELTSIHHLVAVSFGKASHAFCRGNWAVEREGTGMLVNKCSHDFDLIDWWTGGLKAAKISSFGSLFHWRPENRPDGAADRCRDCPEAIRSNCPFDAYALYLKREDLRYHFADQSDAAILEMIETSQYGRCVYACGNDSVDHQTVMISYENGLTVTLEMESYSHSRRRVTHFYGTRGEIVADESTIEVKPFIGEGRVIRPVQEGAHGGGDIEIMTDFIRLIENGDEQRFAEIFDTSLEAHRLAFLAEKSRLDGATVPA